MPDRETTLDAIFTAENRQGTNQYNYRYKEDPNYYTASGYFQIVNSTWRDNAQALGIDTSRYPTAISAPYAVQRQVAGHILDTQGIGPWANYNPAVQPLLGQLDAGQKPYLHSGPKDDPNGVANYLALQGQSGQTPALGQSSGGLQLTGQAPGRGSLTLPPPAPAQDFSKMASLALLQKMLPGTHGLQSVPYDPFVTPKQPSDQPMPGPIQAPQLHNIPSGKPVPVQSQAPGARTSVDANLDKLLGPDIGSPSSPPRDLSQGGQYG